MCSDQTEQLNLPMPLETDGFDDTGDTSNRVIKGGLLKCIDGIWTVDGLPAPKVPLLALSTGTILQNWANQKPIEMIWKRPGQPFPDVDDLNAAVPQSEWEESPIDGNPKPPWQLQLVVYLLAEEITERYTFASGTYGAKIAVSDLKTKVSYKRFMCGQCVLPLVELSSRAMKTKFGQKQRPSFAIVGWRDAGGNAPQITSGLQEPKELTLQEQTQDEVPY
jgi:hypothetical protein